jgi:hypothetical protein
MKNFMMWLAAAALLAVSPFVDAGVRTRPLQMGDSGSLPIREAPSALLLIADGSSSGNSSTTESQTEDGGGSDDGGGSNDGGSATGSGSSQ